MSDYEKIRGVISDLSSGINLLVRAKNDLSLLSAPAGIQRAISLLRDVKAGIEDDLVKLEHLLEEFK